MISSKKMLYGCLVIFLQFCNAPKDEKMPSPEISSEILAADVRRQEVVMDSIIIAQDVEFKQELVIKQQLRNLETKITNKKSRLTHNLDSKEKLTSETTASKN